MRLDEIAHQPDDALDQRSLRNLSVGKQRVVRRVDELRIGTRARDLAEHGQSADAGIEHEDFRCGHEARRDRGPGENGTQGSHDSRPPEPGAAPRPAAAVLSRACPGRGAD